MRRYWRGKVPEWAVEKEEGDDDIPLTTAAASIHMRKDDDPRLRRLAKRKTENRVRQPELDEIRKDHKRVRVPAEIVSESEDEDAIERKRRKIREKLLLQEEAAPLIDSESESEYEIEESEVVAMMVKAVFVPKSNRYTIAERERGEAKEQAVEEESKKRIEAKKKETKEIVVEKIKEDIQIHKSMAYDVDSGVNVDDDDDVNEAEEYEAWKGRETSRIKSRAVSTIKNFLILKYTGYLPGLGKKINSSSTLSACSRLQPFTIAVSHSLSLSLAVLPFAVTAFS